MAEQMGLKVGQAEPFGRQERWILQRLGEMESQHFV